MSDLHAHTKLAKCHPSLERGCVWCLKCGRSESVDSAECLKSGWPKCCGYTMTIDSPQERKALEAEVIRLNGFADSYTNTVLNTGPQ